MIRLWPGILLLPIIGDVDGQRADQMTEQVLTRTIEEKGRIVILDVAGVPTMNTYAANALLRTTSALCLLGTMSIITGISPHAAKTMVHLEVDLSQVTTQNELAAGLELALSHLGQMVARSRS